MNNTLIEYIKENKSIDKVYLNQEGEWQFMPLPSFDEVMTREEILGTTIEEQETPLIQEEVIEEEKQSKKSNTKKL